MLKSLIKKHSDKIRFLIVGSLNTGIDFSLLFIFVNIFYLPVIFSNILSTSFALIFSFFANKKFTFKNDDCGKKQVFIFMTVTLFGLWILQPIIISSVSLIINNTINKDLILFIGKLLATCVTLIWNYLFYSKVVFKNNKLN